MFESVLKRPDTSASAFTVRLTYLSGPSAETDFTVSRQLAGLSDSLKVVKVDTVTEAIAELQKLEDDYQAIVISPALTEQEALAAIHAIRKEESVVTILPVVPDQNSSDAMLTAGATDVMVFTGGTLTDPFDTVGRVTRSSNDAAGSRVVGAAKKKIRNLFSAMRPGPHAGDDRDLHRRRLQARLNQIRITEEASAQQALEEAQEAASTDLLALNHDPATAEIDPSARKRRSSDTFTHAEYETAVNSVRLELARVVDEHAFERAAWERTFQHFEQQLSEIRAEDDSKAELEAALASAQNKLQETVEASDDERTAWKGIREQLEARLHQRETRVDRSDFDAAVAGARAETADVQIRLDTAIAEAESERRRAADTLASERTAWDSARRQLEGELQKAKMKLTAADEEAGDQAFELEARAKALAEATDARGRLEAALAESEKELRKTTEAYATDRTSWAKARHQLEGGLQETSTKLKAAERQAAELATRTKELREADDTRTNLERTLASTRDDLRKTNETLIAERASWTQTRQAIEATHAKAADDHAAALDARAKALNVADGTRAKLEDALARAQADLQKAGEVRAAEQAAWVATRQELDAARTKAGEHHAAELEDRAQELRDAAETRAKLEAALADAKAERQRDLEKYAGERRAWEESRRDFDTLAGQWQTELQQAAALHESEAAARATDRQDADGTIANLEAALARVQADQRDAAEHHAAERAAWATTRQELETAVKNAHVRLEAAETRAAELDTRTNDLRMAAEERKKIEAALTDARAERQKDTERHASETRAWEANRRQLEQDATALQAALQNAEMDRQKTAEKHAADTAEWTASRKALEARVADLQTQTSVRDELETALTSVRAQLAEAIKAHDADRTAWDGKRRLLEARVSELHVASDARDKLEAALTTTRAELQEAVDLHAAERAIWEASRHLSGHGVPPVGKERDAHDETGADGAVKDLELLGAYRALEARLRETTNRLHLVRRTPDLAGSGIGDPGAVDDRRQARSVEEVARLAMAMTPDITDLVSSIEKFGMRLSQQLSPATPEHSEAAAILERSQEARDLLRQLRSFMDKQAEPVITLDLAQAVRSAEPMLGWLVGSHLDFKTILADTAAVNVQGDDFQRMLTALVLAARDLLTVGGSVIVETATMNAGDQPNLLTTSDDGFPALTVTASGYGVQAARVTPALEAAVRQCAGNLSIEDEPNGASRFQVVFAPARQHPASMIYQRSDEEPPKLQSAR